MDNFGWLIMLRSVLLSLYVFDVLGVAEVNRVNMNRNGSGGPSPSSLGFPLDRMYRSRAS